MTTAKFFLRENEIQGFEISGHSGYAPHGEDIVCSAVSSAAIMAANTITEQTDAKADVRMKDGYLYLMLSVQNDTAAAVLSGLRAHLTDISKQYPQYIKIIFGGVKNA